MGFSRQEYRSRLPFTSPGDLSDQGSNPRLSLGRWILVPLSHPVSPPVSGSSLKSGQDWHSLTGEGEGMEGKNGGGRGADR